MVVVGMVAGNLASARDGEEGDVSVFTVERFEGVDRVGHTLCLLCGIGIKCGISAERALREKFLEFACFHWGYPFFP